MSEPIEALRECVTELSAALLTLTGSPSQEEQLATARVIERVREDLGEVAVMLRARA